jgi:uncharacterized repeat protein (TIGR04052 family)
MVFSRAFAALFGVVCLAAPSGCGGSDEDAGPKTFTLSFAAKVGDEPFSCTATFDGVGTAKSAVKPLDFRMYLYDVRLVRDDGSEEPLVLEQDGQWQREKVAFLDFEDGTGTCKTGSPETRTEVVGTAPAGDYTGVRFNLGLPPEMNHLDAATAPAPLNIPGMWWSWKGGYKFVRLDLSSTVNASYFFHLGGTKCQGTVSDGFSCAADNVAELQIDGIDPESSTIVFDIARFYAESDLDHQIDGMTDRISGCMASEGDPECPPVFKALGMGFGGVSPSAPQTAFRVE